VTPSRSSRRSAGAPTIDEAKDLLKQVEIQAEVTTGLVKITRRSRSPSAAARQREVQVKCRGSRVWLTTPTVS